MSLIKIKKRIKLIINSKKTFKSLKIKIILKIINRKKILRLLTIIYDAGIRILSL